MNDRSSIEYINSNPRQVLEEAKSKVNGKPTYVCLLCGNGTGKDGTGITTKDGQHYKCFKCGFYGDIIELIGQKYNITDHKERFKKANELYGLGQNYIKNKPYTDYKHNLQSTHNTDRDKKPNNETLRGELEELFKKNLAVSSETSYLKDRGLSDDLIKRFNIVVDKSYSKLGRGCEAIIIPTDTYSYVARNTDKKADKDDRYRKQGSIGFLNIDALSSGKPVFIVEGEIDALSIIESGAEAIALGSTANINKFVEAVNKHYQDKHKEPSLFIVCMDSDDAGKEAQKSLIAKLQEQGHPFIEATVLKDYKDANEALVKDREGFTQRVLADLAEAQTIADAELIKEKEDYLKNNCSSYIKSFLDDIKGRANTPYIPTGFVKLDEVLDGGLSDGLYFIGAISSLGKTTFTLQIADQIAKSGQDVLVFSLEMARSELMAKSISRETLLKSKSGTVNAKTARGITTYKRYENYSAIEVALITEAVETYAKYSKRLFIIEGVGSVGSKEIREAIERHIKLTGNKPVVIIDYLQIIAPYSERATDKQNTDKSVLELKRISRDYKLSIIGISSFNRESYTSAVSMAAFKESGAIEYSSDVLIGLQLKGSGAKDFNVDEAKQKTPREIELKILKNRNGATGSTIDFKYYPMFNHFTEM